MKSYEVKLTPTERYIASDILNRVADAMTYDSECKEYTDNCNFIYTCSKSELNVLKNILKKI